jgi:hypothetical protein
VLAFEPHELGAAVAYWLAASGFTATKAVPAPAGSQIVTDEEEAVQLANRLVEDLAAIRAEASAAAALQ